MLPLTRSRNRARFFGTPFSPEALFAGGTVAGAWYDPSDLTTLFTTSAGTTQCAMPGGGSAVVVGRMLDKSGNGNHAIAFNDTTARPELRARVNLLEYSEQFDNAVWAKDSCTITANATTAPDGTLTADKVVSAAATTQTGVGQSVTTTAAQFTQSWFAKQAEVRFVQLLWNGGASAEYANFDLQTGIVTQTNASVAPTISAAANGFYRITLTSTSASGTVIAYCWAIDSGTTGRAGTYSGNGANGWFVWGADLRPANIGANVPAYQRIADANTYDTSGFPLYLRFDGIDDSMYTPANLNLSGSDKVAVFAGVRKLAAGVVNIAAELSANSDSNSGAFGIGAPVNTKQYYWQLNAGNRVDGAVNSGYDSPITNVLTGNFDIAGTAPIDEIKGRLNGVDQTLAFSGVVGAGSGNFGTYPLYIGSRGNSNFFFNGHLHSLIIAGSAVSAGNISATEQWVAGKTGIQI